MGPHLLVRVPTPFLWWMHNPGCCFSRWVSTIIFTPQTFFTTPSHLYSVLWVYSNMDVDGLVFMTALCLLPSFVVNIIYSTFMHYVFLTCIFVLMFNLHVSILGILIYVIVYLCSLQCSCTIGTYLFWVNLLLFSVYHYSPVQDWYTFSVFI